MNRPLLILFAINTLNFLDRTLPGSLAEPVRKEFGLSDTGLGLLGTLFHTHLCCGWTAAGTFDRPLASHPTDCDRNRTLERAHCRHGRGTELSVQVFVSRLGAGVGEGGLRAGPGPVPDRGDLFPPHQRARAMGSLHARVLPAGISIAYLCAGAIGAAWGWRLPRF